MTLAHVDQAKNIKNVAENNKKGQELKPGLFYYLKENLFILHALF